MATAAVEERELLKSISWFDGFVVALANPSFLITGLGGSVFSLGGWGAVILWTVSVVLGALHNYIYSELAAMFPKLSGGIAIYAHEAWKRYFSFVGPVAAFGYWIGWSVVLSATGVVVGFLIQAQFYTSSATSGFWTAAPRHLLGIPFYWSFPIALTSVIIVVIWGFNVAGMRPAVWVGYITGALLLIPLAVIMFLPYLTGDWHSSNLHNNIHATAVSLGSSSATLVVVWLYAMCWSSYGMECCATFAPEYHDTARDTPKALRVAAIFGVLVYGLLPLGAVGTFGDQNITLDNYLGNFYASTFHDILGTGTGLAILLLCAGIVLAMNTATADGSRALYGISQDGMTIKWLGKLNSKHVPANAMTLDAVLNIFLLFTFASDAKGALKILIFSNLGYVLCHVFAMSGFLLLRKDRPNWPRPITVAKPWVALAGLLAAFDAVLLVWGGWNSGLAWGDTSKTTVFQGIAVLLIAVVLYVYRVVVQDKRKLAMRVWSPTMPDDVPPAGAATE
ncbi:MAG: APC family permease [Pseudonocardiales bacterium]